MSKVFISYSHKDRDFVLRLASDVGKRLPDATVFYDMLIQPGASWAQSLADEIESADVIIAVLSPDYMESEWCRQEINVGLAKRTQLIPVLVRSCNPTGFLAQLTWVDFTKDYEEAFTRLLWGLTGKRPRAATGDEPGKSTGALDPREMEALRNEVQEAVALFKSMVATRIEPSKSDAGISAIATAQQCFIVMPFGVPDLQIVYEDFVRPTLEVACGLRCERGDDVFGSNGIMDDIIRSIRKADVVLADLTGRNANVFYEVGICHAFDKRVVLLAQSVDDVPFDLRHRRILLYDYSPRGCRRLEKTLKENMLAVLESRQDAV